MTTILEPSNLLIAITGAYEAILPILENSFETLVVTNACPITAAAFLDILAGLFAIFIFSNSKSFARHLCCILKTLAGEKTESFPLPVLVMEDETIAECIVSALLKSPLRRCMTLAKYMRALKSRPQRKGSPETPRHLPKADIDALQTVNMALKNMSDENDLALLHFCSARELCWASDITQYSDTAFGTVPENRRQFDFTLALQGYALGERYAIDPTDTDVQAWIYLLSKAGAEHSVSLSSWYMDDSLTLYARIFALGQQQPSLYEPSLTVYLITISN